MEMKTHWGAMSEDVNGNVETGLSTIEREQLLKWKSLDIECASIHQPVGLAEVSSVQKSNFSLDALCDHKVKLWQNIRKLQACIEDVKESDLNSKPATLDYDVPITEAPPPVLLDRRLVCRPNNLLASAQIDRTPKCTSIRLTRRSIDCLLQRSVAAILASVGFEECEEDVLNLLLNACKKYSLKLCKSMRRNLDRAAFTPSQECEISFADAFSSTLEGHNQGERKLSVSILHKFYNNELISTHWMLMSYEHKLRQKYKGLCLPLLRQREKRKEEAKLALENSLPNICEESAISMKSETIALGSVQKALTSPANPSGVRGAVSSSSYILHDSDAVTLKSLLMSPQQPAVRYPHLHQQNPHGVLTLSTTQNTHNVLTLSTTQASHRQQPSFYSNPSEVAANRMVSYEQIVVDGNQMHQTGPIGQPLTHANQQAVSMNQHPIHMNQQMGQHANQLMLQDNQQMGQHTNQQFAHFSPQRAVHSVGGGYSGLNSPPYISPGSNVLATVPQVQYGNQMMQSPPLAPQTLAPQTLAPQPLAPQPLAPQPLAPQPLAPQPLAPQPLAPQPLAPQPLTGQSQQLVSSELQAVGYGEVMVSPHGHRNLSMMPGESDPPPVMVSPQVGLQARRQPQTFAVQYPTTIFDLHQGEPGTTHRLLQHGTSAQTGDLQHHSQPNRATGSQMQPNMQTCTQMQPNVTVAHMQPNVTVAHMQPNVTVAHMQPNMAVNQMQPNVAVNQMQPNVAVNQMQPNVAVNQMQPAVGSNQMQPTVGSNQMQANIAMNQLQQNISPTQFHQHRASLQMQQSEQRASNMFSPALTNQYQHNILASEPCQKGARNQGQQHIITNPHPQASPLAQLQVSPVVGPSRHGPSQLPANVSPLQSGAGHRQVHMSPGQYVLPPMQQQQHTGVSGQVGTGYATTQAGQSYPVSNYPPRYHTDFAPDLPLYPAKVRVPSGVGPASVNSHLSINLPPEHYSFPSQLSAGSSVGVASFGSITPTDQHLVAPGSTAQGKRRQSGGGSSSGTSTSTPQGKRRQDSGSNITSMYEAETLSDLLASPPPEGYNQLRKKYANTMFNLGQ